MFDINDPRPSPFDRKKKDGESSPAAAKSANLVDKWGNPPTMIDRAFGLKGFGPAKPEAIAPKPAGLKLPQELDDEAKARGRAYGAIGATGMVPQNPAGAPMPQPEKPFFNLNDPRPSPFAIGMQQPATAELPQPVAKVQQQPPGGVMVDRFGNQPSWLERKLGMTNGLRPEGTVPQATPIIDMPQLDPQQIADAQGRGRAYGILPPKQAVQQIAQPVAAQPVSPQSTEATPAAATPQPVAATPITSQVVSDADRLETDRLVKSVMTGNTNENLQKINSDQSVRDTLNKAWATSGYGIQVLQGKNGPMFTNSTGPEKMRYTGADGKPTNDWANTTMYKQALEQNARLKALADGLERQRYLDAGDGERLGAIDRMRQTDASIESAKAAQGIARNEATMKKETHEIDAIAKRDHAQAWQRVIQAKTPEEKEAAISDYDVLVGKGGKGAVINLGERPSDDPLGRPVNLGQAYRTHAGRIEYPNQQLGAGSQGAQQKVPKDKLVKGHTIENNGIKYVWDGENFVKAKGV